MKQRDPHKQVPSKKTVTGRGMSGKSSVAMRPRSNRSESDQTPAGSTGIPAARDRSSEEFRAEFERLAGDVVRVISGELRTPLTSIKGFASTLLQEDVKWTEKDRRDFLKIIEQQSDRLNCLISDVVSVANFQSQGLDLERKLHTVAEVFDSIMGTLAILTRQHKLNVIIPGRLPAVFIDLDRIAEVILVLVDNAATASQPGDPITIRVTARPLGIEIEVKDRGLGGSGRDAGRKDVVQNLEAHDKGERTTTGMEFCRQVVLAHGGRVNAESQAGRGFKVTVTLPQASFENAGAGTATPRKTGNATRKHSEAEIGLPGLRR